MAGRRPNIQLDRSMSPAIIARALDNIVFTAAHDWQRAVSIDEDVRDRIVEALNAHFRLKD